MIVLSTLMSLDKGKLVTYKLGTSEEQVGILKSWNERLIFVVFNFNNDPHNYENYTAAGCRPEDLYSYKDTLAFRKMRQLLHTRRSE